MGTLHRASTSIQAPHRSPRESQASMLIQTPLLSVAVPLHLPTPPPMVLSAVLHTRHPTLASQDTQPTVPLMGHTLSPRPCRLSLPTHQAPLALLSLPKSRVTPQPSHRLETLLQREPSHPREIHLRRRPQPVVLPHQQALPQRLRPLVLVANLHTPRLRESLRSTTITTRSPSVM